MKHGIDWDTVPLGAAPDTQIARQYGTTYQAVQQARKWRGVPPYGRPGRHYNRIIAAARPAFVKSLEFVDLCERVLTKIPTIAAWEAGQRLPDLKRLKNKFPAVTRLRVQLALRQLEADGRIMRRPNSHGSWYCYIRLIED